MRKKKLIVSVLAGITILVSIVLAYSLNIPASAKNQPTPQERMAIYSPPKNQQQAQKIVRISRLKQMNIVGEAATVLNVLPINIIDEMKKGKTIVQISQEKGLTEKEFTQKLTDLENQTLNTAVKDGTIPKKHADAINAGRTDRLKNAMKQKAMNVNDHAPMDMGN